MIKSNDLNFIYSNMSKYGKTSMFSKKNIDFHLCIYFHSYIISSYKKL